MIVINCKLVCREQVDPETGDYVRDSSGFCVQSGVNEPGEMVGAIRRMVRTSDFDGYTDSKATNKKVYRQQNYMCMQWNPSIRIPLK